MATSEVERMIVTLVGDASSFRAMMKEASRLARDVGQEMQRLGGIMTKAFTLPLTGIGAFATKLAADAEQVQVAFEVMTGSAKTASDLIQEIRTMGAKTPFQTKDLEVATKLLLNFGRTSDVVLKDLDMLSNVAAGDKNRLQSLALVFGQVAANARLTGGDLLQFINAGFNPLLQISERTGESMTELRDRMSAGLVSFDEVRQAFVDVTSEGGRFYQMNERQSKTLLGVWSTLKDKITEALRELGQTLVPFARKTVNFVSDMVSHWKALSNEQKAAIVKIGAIVAALGPGLIVMGKVATGIAAISQALSVLRVALISTGVGAAVVALGALAAVLATNETAMKEVQNILKPFKGLWVDVQELLKELQPMLSELAVMIGTELKRAFETLKPVVKAVVIVLVDQMRITIEVIKEAITLLEKLRDMKVPGGGGFSAQDALGFVSGPFGFLSSNESQSKRFTRGGGNFISDFLMKGVTEYAKATTEMKAVKDEVAQQKGFLPVSETELKLLEASADAIDENNRKLKEQMELEQRRQQNIKDTITALKEQVETYGMSRKELALYKAEQQGATSSQLAMIASLQDSLMAKEKATKATDDARIAEKRFRDSISGFGIQGVGRDIEALARVAESRRLRASGLDIKPNVSAGQKSKDSGFVLQANQQFGFGDVVTQLQYINKNTAITARKKGVEIKPANIGG